MNELNFKGTKGKWSIERDYIYLENSTNIISSTHRICEVKNYYKKVHVVLEEPTKEEARANALLISKAPEMLEMLKRAADALYIHDIDLRFEINELIQEAIELNI